MPPQKKAEPAASGKTRPVNSALERLASVTERGQQQMAAKAVAQDEQKKQEAYRWRAQKKAAATETEPVTTPKALRSALEYEKNAGTGRKAGSRSDGARCLGGGNRSSDAAETGTTAGA
ncbi:hypothetical protein [Dickeya oryzae]